MRLFVPLLVLFVSSTKGQRVASVEFENADLLPTSLTGMLPAFGNCIEVDSDFVRFSSRFSSRSPVSLDCICAYEGPGCTGRVQRLLSSVRAAGRVQRLRFQPNSFKECRRSSVPTPVFRRRPTSSRRDPFGLEDPNTCRAVNPLSTGDLEDLVLEIHNDYRRQHGVDPLVLNQSLSDSAQLWADELARRTDISHSFRADEEEFGENLGNIRSERVDNEETAVNDIVDSWYNEIQDYDFNNPGFSRDTYRFTQMIWAENTDMGVATAFNRNTCEYILVVHYAPGGNPDGPTERAEFRTNVFPRN